MQEMNQEREPGSGAGRYGGGYEGTAIDEDWGPRARGQKLDAEGETYEDTLVHRLRLEMLADLKRADERLNGQRLLLALVSVSVLAIMFIVMVLAVAFGHLTHDAFNLLGVTMFFLLGAIVIINAYFIYYAGGAAKKPEVKEPEKNQE
jgi:hypothetical protein